MKKNITTFIAIPLIVRLFMVIVLIAAAFGISTFLTKNKTSSPTYQTAQVERGVLIQSVSGSGTVTANNNASIATQTSGVVQEIYVKDGDVVTAGQKLALIELDTEGKQKANQALSAYKNAKISAENAKIAYYSLQSDLLNKWGTFMDVSQNSTYQNPDGSPNTTNRTLPAFVTTNNDWLSAEAKYKNQSMSVSQTQLALTTSWNSYQLASPTIIAPISGKLTGFSLQPGTIIGASNNSTTTSQKIASIITNAKPQITIQLTERDVIKVHQGDKATITIDALGETSYTGKVVSIDTVGSTSSNVTNYPTVIMLDTMPEQLLNSMAAQATIITQTFDDVLMIPSTAIVNQNGQKAVRTLDEHKNIIFVPIQTGESSSDKTIVTSGLNEGETIISSIQSTVTSPSRSTQSPFSAFGNQGFRVGANAGGARTGR